MLHVFLAFVVLGNKLQYLELNYDCLFVCLFMIYFRPTFASNG